MRAHVRGRTQRAAPRRLSVCPSASPPAAQSLVAHPCARPLADGVCLRAAPPPPQVRGVNYYAVLMAAKTKDTGHITYDIKKGKGTFMNPVSIFYPNGRRLRGSPITPVGGSGETYNPATARWEVEGGA
eukprot:6110965-Prymnesium_polylepis.1